MVKSKDTVLASVIVTCQSHYISLCYMLLTLSKSLYKLMLVTLSKSLYQLLLIACNLVLVTLQVSVICLWCQLSIQFRNKNIFFTIIKNTNRLKMILSTISNKSFRRISSSVEAKIGPRHFLIWTSRFWERARPRSRRIFSNLSTFGDQLPTETYLLCLTNFPQINLFPIIWPDK